MSPTRGVGIANGKQMAEFDTAMSVDFHFEEL
jgi:hypothetical protein